MPKAESIAKLEAELERLGRIRGRPNLLRDTGGARAERRHSYFLAYLLNPQESHGFGNRFLRRFLRLALCRDYRHVAGSLGDIERLDLSDALVKREKHHIDVLVLAPKAALAVILENKVDSKEHSNQLQRYWDEVPAQYPWVRTRVGLFLSPEGTAPINAQSPYIPVPYSYVCRAGEEIFRESAEFDALPLEHPSEYLRIIREEFMGDPQASSVAWKIHQQHQDALAFVQENPPMAQVRQKIRSLVADLPASEVRRVDDGEIAFAPLEWSEMPLLRDVEKKKYDLFLLFWFDDFGDEVRLSFGADPVAAEVVRRLKELTVTRRDLFAHGVEVRYDWPTIWWRRFVNANDLTSKTRDDVMKQIEQRWGLFKDTYLPRIAESVRKTFA